MLLYSCIFKTDFRVGRGSVTCFPKITGARGTSKGEGSSLTEANRLPGITTAKKSQISPLGHVGA